VRSLYRPPWRIDVTIRDRLARPLPIGIARLADAIAGALDTAGAPRPAAVGLILSDDDELAELNARHLGDEGATDVLSFPLLPPESFPRHADDVDHRTPAGRGSPATFTGPPGRRTNLGDLIVSVERAVEQAAKGRGGQTGDVRWSAADELRLLVTHGTLHLCGWDHAEPAEEQAMRALEQRLLAGG